MSSARRNLYDELSKGITTILESNNTYSEKINNMMPLMDDIEKQQENTNTQQNNHPDKKIFDFPENL